MAVVVLTVVFIGQDVCAQPLWYDAEPGIRKDPVVANRLKVRLQPGIAMSLHSAILESRGLTVLYAVLPFERSLTAEYINGSQKNSERTLAIDNVMSLEEPLLRSYVVEFDGEMSPEKMVSLLRPVCSEIEVCETVPIAQLAAIPDDPEVGEQRLLETIRAFDAWDVEEGNTNVVIGISDSGVLQSHEDLKDNIYVNTLEVPDNGVDDDNNGYIDDYRGYNFTTLEDGTLPGDTDNKTEGHGTGVAGIAGATTNNAIGIAGVAGKCTIWPLKTQPENIPGIVYGYESIMYCALNGIQIVNCSWGGFSSSCINQSIVDYAVARGVAVVAAAGNHGTTTPFYPGSYNGVLNVGVTNPSDDVISMTGHGPTVDIMAPGQGTRTTSADGTYGSFCCTSGSSPIVAGVVALVMSQRGSLSGLEACSVVREMAKTVQWSNVPENVDERLLPRGRVDALSAVSARPELLSLEPLGTQVSTTSTDTRWSTGDSISVRIRAMNIGSEFHFDEFVRNDVIAGQQPALNRIGDARNIVNQIVPRGDTILLPAITAVVVRDTDTTEFLEAVVKAIDKNDKKVDIIMRTSVVPSPPYRDFENASLALSVGDRARIGNANLDKGQGMGFNYKQWCGQLFEGGLMITAHGRVVDAVRGIRGRSDHFSPVKRFTRPNPFTSIVNDSDAPDSMVIGVEVEQRVSIGGADSAYVVIDISIKNISGTTIHDLAAGWFYDWDLGTNPAANTTALQGQTPTWAEQKIESTTPGEPTVIVGSVSGYDDASPISAGIDNTTTYRGITPERKAEMLRSGTGEQYSGTNDVAAVCGMRFTGAISPGQSRAFRHYIAVGEGIPPVELRDRILANYEALIEQQQIGGGTINLPRPNPAAFYVQIDIPVFLQRFDVRVYDLQGRAVVLVPEDKSRSSTTTVTLDVRALGTGQYLLRTTGTDSEGRNHVFSSPLTILR